MASIEGRGPRQVIKALGYSAKGLRAAFRFESSFRLEVYLSLILAPLALYLGADAIERILMFGSLLLVLAVELLNGAVEAIVDKTTPEYHELAGRSKDMGSAAVFLCMVNVVVTWSLILLPRYLGGS
ncbi:MAG: diacylglycerol kinase [Lysobacterales bacterium]